MSLGKGFYEFTFTSLEDVRRVRSIASWNLNPGTLKLFAWSSDFNPRAQQNSSAQVWVRLYGLSQEYWRKNILFTIASSLGTPICTDSVTAKPLLERTFGQFARVLIDTDLTQTLRDKVLVERKGFAFLVNIEYENLPNFCTNCKVIGHYVANCKKLIPIDDGKFDKDIRDRRTTNKEPKKVFVPTKEGRQGQDKSLNPKPHDQQRDDSSNSGKDKEVANMNDQFNIIGNSNQSPQSDKSQCSTSQGSKTDKETTISHNRFEVLTTQNIDDIDVEATEETPVIDIESTKDTEGVEDTQVEVVLNKDETLRLETNVANKTTEFLNQSWANMVDAEEEELKTQEIAEHENLV
ncbi:uncharacterized protein LOC123914862 [Trifolium pratense]|uniref:uncharacterized protein LOC123914862 n=1 Tax=Trifolium pratense TaxID=57577 RepID=UPI001E692A25|nr:uncharacterized protein LOC123914862 [Trifolium pratense]